MFAEVMKVEAVAVKQGRESRIDGVAIDRLFSLGKEAGPELVKMLVHLFVTTAPGRYKALARAASTRNRKGVRGLAHDLKSDAGNLGARRVEQLARELETLADEDAWESVDARVLRLEVELEEVQRELNEMAITIGRKS